MRRSFVFKLAFSFAVLAAALSARAAFGEITFTSTTHYFGVVVDGTSTLYGVKATNTDSTAFPFALTLTGSSDFSLSSSSCGSSIAAGKSCEIIFSYAPTTPTQATAAWSLAANGRTFSPANGGTLSGNGSTSVQFNLTSASHDFGTQIANTTSTSLFGVVLSNTTSETIKLNLVTTGADHVDFPLITNSCGATLLPHGTCNLVWQFMPAGVDAYAENFAVSGTDAATGETVQLYSQGSTVSAVKLRGSGIASSNVNMSTGGHAFYEIPNGLISEPYGVLLRNATTSPISIAFGTVPNGFKKTASNCGTTLAAEASCDMQFKFEPKTLGDYSGTYAVSAYDSTGAQISVYTNGGPTTGLLFTGTSITGGLALSNSSNTFGVYVPGQQSAQFETTLTNTTAVNLYIALAEDGGTDDSNFDVSAGNCPDALAPNASCTVDVRYAPMATGTQNLFESVFANDETTTEPVGVYDSSINEIVDGISYTGYAIATAALKASKTSHAFGEVGATGTSAHFSTMLSNSTDYNLTLSTSWSDPSESANFTLYSTTCGSTLAAHSVCEGTFEFTPQSVGSFTDTFQIEGTSAGYSNTVGITLTGTGIN